MFSVTLSVIIDTVRIYLETLSVHCYIHTDTFTFYASLWTFSAPHDTLYYIIRHCPLQNTIFIFESRKYTYGFIDSLNVHLKL